MNPAQPATTLVASTSEPDAGLHARPADRACDPPFFRDAQWSADGTTLFTTSSTNRFSAFVVPHNLLEPRSEPLTLQAQGTLKFAEPTYEVAPCPYFSLDSPETQVALAATRDHPIHLYPIFSQSTEEGGNSSSSGKPPPLAHYNLIKPETEQYLPVRSMIWPGAGTHFIAGTKDLVAVFDVNHAEPLLPIKTIPSKRHRSAGHGIGMRGTVSALAARPGQGGSMSLVCAGTWQRSVALYDLMRAGEAVGIWSVKDADPAIGGDGVMQTVWSPCGNYLVINERQATGLLVYDMRMTKQLVVTLAGRVAPTHQKLKCDVFPSTAGTGGFETWAGTQDGTVRVWEGVGNQEGIFESTWNWKGHGAPVGSTAVHSCGSVVATCSGDWKVPTTQYPNAMDDEDIHSPSYPQSPSSSSESDSECSDDSSDTSSSDGSTSCDRESLHQRLVVEETSLKIWTIGPGSEHTPIQDNADGTGE